jgi:hypothetical protein
MSIGDTLFAMTEWVRTTPVVEASLWVAETPFCLWLQETYWAIPSFQAIHIIAIAILFGSTLMMSLKVLGYTGQSRTLGEVVERFMPWMWGGFWSLICTGIILLISEPVRNGVNAIFWMKMCALLVAILVTLAYSSSLKSAIRNNSGAAAISGSLKTTAVVVLILWCLVMMGGRWIAYAPV